MQQRTRSLSAGESSALTLRVRVFVFLFFFFFVFSSLSGLAPFSCRGDDQESLRQLIRSGTFHFPAPQWTRVSASAKDMVRSLLNIDPARRMTIEQAEAHPWMQIGKKRKETASASTDGQAEKRRVPVPAAAAAAAAARPTPPTIDEGAATMRPANGR